MIRTTPHRVTVFRWEDTGSSDPYGGGGEERVEQDTYSALFNLVRTSDLASDQHAALLEAEGTVRLPQDADVEQDDELEVVGGREGASIFGPWEVREVRPARGHLQVLVRRLT